MIAVDRQIDSSGGPQRFEASNPAESAIFGECIAGGHT